MNDFLGTIGTGFLILCASTLFAILATALSMLYASFMSGIRITDMPQETIEQARAFAFTVMIVCTIAGSVYMWVI